MGKHYPGKLHVGSWPPKPSHSGKKYGLHSGAPIPSTLPDEVIHSTSTIPTHYRVGYRIEELIPGEILKKLRNMVKRQTT